MIEQILKLPIEKRGFNEIKKINFSLDTYACSMHTNAYENDTKHR